MKRKHHQVSSSWLTIGCLTLRWEKISNYKAVVLKITLHLQSPMEKHCQTSRKEDLVLTPPAESEVCIGATRCRFSAGDASGLPGGDTSRVSVSLNCGSCLILSQKHELLPSFKMRDLNIIMHGFPSATEMSNYTCFIIWRPWLRLMLVNIAVLATKEHKLGGGTSQLHIRIVLPMSGSSP